MSTPYSHHLFIYIPKNIKDVVKYESQKLFEYALKYLIITAESREGMEHAFCVYLSFKKKKMKYKKGEYLLNVEKNISY